jgi:hypothetical protein
VHFFVCALENKIRIECAHRMPSGIRERHTELATLECIRTQCNSEGKVAKYSQFFRPLRYSTGRSIEMTDFQTEKGVREP